MKVEILVGSRFMSDVKVAEVLDQMETWLGDPSREFEPEALDGWNREYVAAVEAAERGPGWADLVVRAHSLGDALNLRLIQAMAEQDLIRLELASFAIGNRALKGYGASTK